MIHIATVHYNSTRWIDIQLRFIEKHIGTPYLTYAFLTGIDPTLAQRFHYAVCEPVVSHAFKLNFLADIISRNAEPTDILMFIDGDAFPVSSIDSLINQLSHSTPLIAIQRLENGLDIQPHPSFCITTVGFWNSIKGDWNAGYTWKTPNGNITDIGGNLLEQLQQKGIDWLPIHRTKNLGSHPLLFGVYGSCIYHHGAGFRAPHTRSDLDSKPKHPFWRAISKLIPASLPMKIRYKLHAYTRLYSATLRQNMKESQQIFEKIENAPTEIFYNE